MQLSRSCAVDTHPLSSHFDLIWKNTRRWILIIAADTAPFCHQKSIAKKERAQSTPKLFLATSGKLVLANTTQQGKEKEEWATHSKQNGSRSATTMSFRGILPRSGRLLPSPASRQQQPTQRALGEQKQRQQDV